MGEDLTKIAVLLVGVALVALLIGHAGGTAQVIAAGTSGFNQLLRTVTLQNPYPFGGGLSMGSLSLPSLNTGLYSSGGLIQ
jgi:hypothetical protein